MKEISITERTLGCTLIVSLRAPVKLGECY